MKKSLLKEAFPNKWGKLKKMLLIMKLTIFLTCLMIFEASAGIYSQSMKINLSMTNVTVEELSQWFVDQLLTDITTIDQHQIQKITAKVFSAPGQSGSATWERQS